MSARSLNRVNRLLTNRVAKTGEVAGAVVLVRDREGVVFHEAYGLRQKIPSEQAMTKRTVFDLASLTKPVCTSLLAMIMTERGRLNPDERLANWFSPLGDPEKGKITLRQLLSNRSGLPAWRPYYQECPRGPRPVDQEEIVGRILAEPLEGPPGEREIYSDLGFILLGSILEKVGGLPLDRLFQEEVATPLGLRDTGYRRISGLHTVPERTDEPIAATEYCPWRGRVLVGEVHDENCYILGGVAGHAGLFSTAADLDRVVAELFEGSRGRSDLFSPRSMSTFFQRQDPLGRGSWALGWDTPSEGDSASGHHYSKNSFGHNGFTGTSLWMDFGRHVSVVFLTNRVHPTRENVAIRGLRPLVHDAVFEEMYLVRNDLSSENG